MHITDPIGDMLTRIRNGVRSRQTKVDIPASKLKTELAKILKSEGYVANFKVNEGTPATLRVYLRYGPHEEGVITDLQRVSRPGCRIYCRKDAIPRVYGGLGINILSTPKGLMTGRAAQTAGVGGEILCNVW